MKKISILKFDDFCFPLLENVQSAKDYLYKIAKIEKAEKNMRGTRDLPKNKNIDLRGIDLTDEEKNQALTIPRFTGGANKGQPIFSTLKDFLEKKNSMSYLYPFVYFALEMPNLEIGLSDEEMLKKIGEIEKNTGKSENQKKNEIENIENDLNFSNLIRKLKKQKQIGDRSPLQYKNIEGYIKAKEDGKFGENAKAIEILNDELDNKIREIRIFQFFNEVPSIIRDYFKDEVFGKKDSSPQMNDLFQKTYELVNDLYKQEPKKGTIKVYKRDSDGNRTNEILKEYPNQAQFVVISQSGIYKDSRNYPDISNPKKPEKAYDHFINKIKGVIESWGQGLNDILNKIDDISPAIKILDFFEEENILVTSSRSWWGIKEICKISNANYCIENQSTWRSTVSENRLQISINQMNLPKNNMLFLLSFTLEKKGKDDFKVEDFSNRSNSKFNPLTNQSLPAGKNFDWYLKEFNVPRREEILASVKKSFETESRIKNLLDKVVYSNLGKVSENSDVAIKMVLSYLGSTSIESQIEEKIIDEKDWEDLCGLIIDIIKKEFKMNEGNVKEYFIENGFNTVQDFQVYHNFLEDNFDWDDAEKIFNESKEQMDLVQMLSGFDSKISNVFSSMNRSFATLEKIFQDRELPWKKIELDKKY